MWNLFWHNVVRYITFHSSKNSKSKKKRLKKKLKQVKNNRQTLCTAALNMEHNSHYRRPDLHIPFTFHPAPSLAWPLHSRLAPTRAARGGQEAHVANQWCVLYAFADTFTSSHSEYSHARMQNLMSSTLHAAEVVAAMEAAKPKPAASRFIFYSSIKTSASI